MGFGPGPGDLCEGVIHQSPGRPAGVLGGVGLAGDVGHYDRPFGEQHELPGQRFGVPGAGA